MHGLFAAESELGPDAHKLRRSERPPLLDDTLVLWPAPVNDGPDRHFYLSENKKGPHPKVRARSVAYAVAYAAAGVAGGGAMIWKSLNPSAVPGVTVANS